MSPRKPLFYIDVLKAAMAVGFILFFASCSVVPKNYPKNKAFVYEYKIKLEGNFSGAEKTELESKLANQLDDSIHVRSARKLFYKGINRPVLNKPPVYDNSNADRSVLFMDALLNSLGYFKDTITYHTDTVFVKPDQYRSTVTFSVKPGKPVRLDSISYNIKQQELQSIALANLKESYLKKGNPFASGTISSERDRLTDLYRNNGYLRFSSSELQGLWDTLDVSLLSPSLDPFEQLAVLDSMKKRREDPKANLEIRLKPGFDTSKLVKYYIGNIKVYPDYGQDKSGYSMHEIMVDGVKIIYNRKLFKPKILPQNIFFRSGDLYNQSKYLKTLNRFNSLGAWRSVTIEQPWRKNEDTVDVNIRLAPAKKYAFNTSLEGSHNQSVIEGSLFGLAINFGLQNKNFGKAANQANTNIRFGIETGRDTATHVKFIQTRQLSFSHTIYFPRPIPNSRIIPQKLRDNFRTVFSFNAAYTERRELYNLTTLNASWGYEFQWKKKGKTAINNLSFRLPDIEYSLLDVGPGLDTLFKNNPILRNIFTDGIIASVGATYSVSGGKKNNLNFFRTNVEESGLLTGLIHTDFLDSNLYRFVKADAEFSRIVRYKNKTSLVLRAFAGAGYELNSTVSPRRKNNLPFFREYSSGGPNSMRAWQLRKLGPGSVIKDFDTTPERYGDVQLEANVEYRFPLANISSINLQGAVFTDIGNIWFLKKAAGLPEEVFSFSRLGKDLAVGTGAGLRIDFSFFVLRFDYSYKVKDPSPNPQFASVQNKWFGYKFSKGDQFQLGINYPFIF
jgi:outer membrane protein insertion porin family